VIPCDRNRRHGLILATDLPVDPEPSEKK